MELNFEASGALMKASLVMRDRETDSWWSIMTSQALAGEMEGAELVELPFGEKTTWGAWRAQHPETEILSVDGREHEPQDSYSDYFASDRTFRDLEIGDKRLPPKEPVYAFWLDGRPHAVAQKLAEGGRFFALDKGGRVFLYREEGAAIFASTLGFLAPEDGSGQDTTSSGYLEYLRGSGAQRLQGFDTFWYSWVAINQDTELLR